MSAAFSSSSELAVRRAVHVASVESGDLEELYQIVETCRFVTGRQFKKVALQFPDELLVVSVPIAAAIENETKAKTYILGDTSYGSCCVDEVAAEHVGADCMVHYGGACLSPSMRLPVKYVFGRRPMDVGRCAAAFRDLYPDSQSHVVILYDVVYSHAIGRLVELLTITHPNLVPSELDVDHSHGQLADGEITDTRVARKFGRRFGLQEGLTVEDYSMFYVGSEGVTLTNFMMTWNRCSFCSFNPQTSVGRAESVNINKALMKRYYAIERAKDANVVGILVGTLGVANYLTIIEQLKECIHKAGKKTYMFAMGKLNVAKLANFLEIDVYVVIACPENSLLDSSELYRPVVTPFEMEVACNRNREWTGEYVTDFRDLLPGGCSHVGFPEADNETTDVSLITGALRTTGLQPSASDTADGPSGSLVLRNQAMTVANPNTAAVFLAGRSWQGLEPKLGETPVVKAVEGRKGIAIAYEDEGEDNRKH
ncbi:2-(3-amino-3-carboxypropyl)histidine synthase subunit 2 [Denticeps clupeoides]|uniref:2-(3-amino-3-carboxypropyl)histidine synthase subunit 2 n=1 Tax=Denticeps clupeoides TaxID=299321 RepID=UPI0010A4AEC3|nr:2-(3-amino-3-carboxypropyl)histidine synthase subunit 2 [Denticeps clupeoides]XP_028826133.1 2-(3-amino-3-carboxypropyl)histidine synthase subunit 2 [Denticeps clupeoides]